ncbi:MAG: hypothetical protein IPK28_06370 [Devosia sp.]|nr:hypothetical protein [Devosia sp.]
MLSLRERGYVEIARMSGCRPWHHLLRAHAQPAALLSPPPWSTPSPSAILASIGLEVLGLGPIDAPTLGMTLYWVNFNAAMINGWWWWWLSQPATVHPPRSPSSACSSIANRGVAEE